MIKLMVAIMALTWLANKAGLEPVMLIIPAGVVWLVTLIRMELLEGDLGSGLWPSARRMPAHVRICGGTRSRAQSSASTATDSSIDQGE